MFYCSMFGQTMLNINYQFNLLLNFLNWTDILYELVSPNEIGMIGALSDSCKIGLMAASC